MASEKISRVGIVGAGQMGAGIAEVCARAGVDVLVYETSRDLATAGRARILRSLDRGVSSGSSPNANASRHRGGCASPLTSMISPTASWWSRRSSRRSR